MLYFLRTRAWFFYSSLTLYRVTQALTKTGYWFEETESCSAEKFEDCLGQYR